MKIGAADRRKSKRIVNRVRARAGIDKPAVIQGFKKSIARLRRA